MIAFAVTLLSGGLDSTTVTKYAADRVDRLTAITFQYGQTHSKEVECAANVAELMGVDQHLVDITFLSELAWYSALTNPHQFQMPQNRRTDEIGIGVPLTYVPLRNTIFLALSAAYLESEVLNAIEVEGLDYRNVSAHLYMAPNAIDYSGYPDCRPEFYDTAERTLEYGSKLWTQYGIKIQIELPIIELSKAEIAEMGIRLNAPLAYTWSCYQGRDTPCGSCDSCILRANGFKDAGVLDPLMVRLGKA